VWLSGSEERVIDQASRKCGALPVNAEHLAQLACVLVDAVAGKEQHRNRLAGNPPQLTILGQQDPIIAGTEVDKLAVRLSSLCQESVVARSSEPPGESAQHRIA
jgi:hypothetical protein